MELARASIAGSNISVFHSYEEVYILTQTILKNGFEPAYVTVNNAHTIVEGVCDHRYRTIINEAAMALPDGKPLSVIQRLRGHQCASRIFGPTFLEKTIEWGQVHNTKHYFFGSSLTILDGIMRVIAKKYPDAVVVGSFSPPYREFTKEENEDFVRQMNESGADIFWIGLGAPKQEVWMRENYEKLHRGVMIGIGAGFDYLAGNTKHAPVWMKNLALEWLYRFIQEPRRLWKRYLVTNTLFLLFVLAEFLKIRNFNK